MAFEIPERVMAVEVHQNEEISRGEKNGGNRSRLCYPSKRSEQVEHKYQGKRARRNCSVREKV